MTLNEWTRQAYAHLRQAATNISDGHQLSEELLHYSLEQLLTKPNLQEILDSGGAQFYVIRIMLNSWKSTTSPFYTIYRDPRRADLDSYLEKHEVADAEPEPETDLSAVHEALDGLYWYDRQLFTLYLDEGRNISGLAKKTGIPRTSISLTLKRVKSHLKQKITPND